MLSSVIGLSQDPNGPRTEFDPNSYIKANTITPASPGAASLGNFGDTPVNYFTGSPNIGIPLHTIAGNYLSSPINLGYDVNSVKLSAIPGWEGLGWSLQAGGVITRSTVGYPDMGDNYFNYVPPSGEPDISSTPVLSIAYHNMLIKANCGGVEVQPDRYSFSMPGFSGSFIVLPDETVVQKDYQGLEITPTVSNGRLTKFIIKDSQGREYTFDEKEESRMLTSNNPPQGGGGCNNYLGVTLYFYSSWYLSSIKSADNSEELVFSYGNTSAVDGETFYPMLGNVFGSSSLSCGTEDPGSPFSNDCCPAFYDCSNSNGSLFQSAKVYDRKYLSTITLNIAGQGVEKAIFTVADAGDNHLDRKSSGIKLTSVKVQRKWQSSSYQDVLRFDFGYSFATGRLTLETLQEFGYEAQSTSWISKPAYDFQYDAGVLPPVNDQGIDHWGFYNAKGATNQNSLIPDVEFECRIYGEGADRNASLKKHGTIKRVVYPTKGYSDYDFVGSSANYSPINPCPTVTDPIDYNTVGGFRINSIKDYEADGTLLLRREFKYVKSDGSTSSGVLLHVPNYTIRSLDQHDPPPGILAQPPDPCIDNFQSCTRVTVLSASRGNGYGPHVGYSRVEEIHQNASGQNIGKTVYHFDAQGVNINQIWGRHRNGKQLKVEVYHKNGNLLHETISQYGTSQCGGRCVDMEVYESVSDIIQDNKPVLCEQVGYAEWRAMMGNYSPPTCEDSKFYPNSKYKRQTKYLKQEFLPLTLRTVNEYFYENGTQMMATTTTYEYGDVGTPGPTAVYFTNSDGKTHRIETTYHHSGDIHIPKTVTSKVAGQVIGGSDTDYDANGRPTTFHQILPGGSTLQRATISSYNSQGRPDDYSYMTFPKDDFIWVNGLLTTRSKTDGNETWTWSYNYDDTRLPISITDIDGQVINYTYDGFLRLKTNIARSGNVSSAFDYHYATSATDRSYVKSTTTFTPVSGSNLTTQTSWQYFDGMGRLLQTVHQQKSPNQKDVVEAVEYDAYGRSVKQYKPRASLYTDGRYIQPAFYWPYSETTYEDSPLSRIEATKPPSWYDTTIDYGSNAANEVKLDLSSNTYYSANLLYKETVTDPNGNKSITFKDKAGRLILTRQTDASGGNETDTYYVYDDEGRVTMVVPPDAAPSSSELIFEYTYDTRSRVTSKKVPGAAAVTMKYNNRDELTLMQDGNLAPSNTWMHFHYDLFGRQRKTGFVINSNPNPNSTLSFSEQLTQANYGTSGISKGKVTYTKAKVLGTSNNWIYSYIYYDNYGRVSYTRGNNHLYNYYQAERTDFIYDFADYILSENKDHRQSYFHPTVYVDQTYEYDHWGRQTHHRHRINNGTDFTIAKTDYDAFDRMTDKHLHETISGNFLQDIDYYYNQQDWLTQINDFQCINQGGGGSQSAQAPEGEDFEVEIGFTPDAFGLEPTTDGPNLKIRVNGMLTSLDSGTAPVQVDRIYTVESQPDDTYSTTQQLTGYDDLLLPQSEIYSLKGVNIQYDNMAKLLAGMEEGLIAQLEQAGMPEEASVLVFNKVQEALETAWQPISTAGFAVAEEEALEGGMAALGGGSSNDLFAMKLYYDNTNSTLGATAQKNGNIAYMGWQVGCNDPAYYGMQYDYLDRIKKANYADLDKNTNAYKNFNRNNLDLIIYDKRGNIKNLRRKGWHYGTTYSFIDLLSLSYLSGTNQLDKVYESISYYRKTKGFKSNTGGYQYYTHDANGNQTSDGHRGISSVEYNHLNLPKKVTWSNGDWIEWTYDANGTKLKKETSAGDVKHYINGIEYDGSTIEAIYHAEGRASWQSNTWQYEYTLRDHLGNTRVTFADLDDDDAVDETEILQENHYYPFGMNIEGSWSAGSNDYQYNGKELNTDFGLDWNDYGARWYDAGLGRFTSIDPAIAAYYSISPFAYVANNPLIYIDPTGAYIEKSSQKEWEKQTKLVKKQRESLQKKLSGLEAQATEKGWSAEKLAKKAGNLSGRIESLNSTISTFETIENSSQGYSLTSSDSEVTGLTYKSDGIIDILFSTTSNFVHEVTHAGQFESGDIAFSSNGSSLLQDVGDEVAAYKAQFGFKPSSVSGLNSNSKADSFSKITASWVQNITTSTGDKIYAPGGTSNTGVSPVNINSSRDDFIKSYPHAAGALRGLPASWTAKDLKGIIYKK